jgi:hypothetical protein
VCRQEDRVAPSRKCDSRLRHSSTLGLRARMSR